MSRKDRKFKGFFRPKLGDLQIKKKKKRSSPKFRAIFLPISQLQTFEGGLFSYGGGYFPFFTENRLQKHKKHAILHASQHAPPWLRYWALLYIHLGSSKKTFFLHLTHHLRKVLSW